MPDPDDAALPPAPLSSEPPAAEKVGEEADGKAAAPKPATNADRSPLLGTDRGLPRQDERESSFAHEPPFRPRRNPAKVWRSEEHTSELQSLMRISYAVFCLKKKKQHKNKIKTHINEYQDITELREKKKEYNT